MIVGCIWAQSRARVIGKDNAIPWRYPGDFRRFKELTLGGAIIMGRLTYESIGKALPGRANVVVSSRPVSLSAAAAGPQATSVTRAASVEAALAAARIAKPCGPIWFIGGARIYEAASPLVDVLDVTTVPDEVDPAGAVLAPAIDDAAFAPGPVTEHPYEPTLTVQRFLRRYP